MIQPHIDRAIALMQAIARKLRADADDVGSKTDLFGSEAAKRTA